MAKVSFNSQEEMDARVAELVEAQLSDIRANHAAEIAALNELLNKAREANATADYSAFSAHPDLIELLKKTDLRPGALPALCALQIWQGLTTSKAICAAIPTTPKLGEDKGGKPSTSKMITSALQKLEKALIAANQGIGIRVKSVRGPDGDSEVRRIRFTPIVDEDFAEPAIAATETTNEAEAA